MIQARPIPEKVRRLVPVLGSPVDGEALGAARAIGRVLTGAGLGFTDLASAIPTRASIEDVSTSSVRPAPPAATVPEFHAYRWRRAYTPRQEQQHRTHVAFCQSQPWRLTEWERRFLDGIARQHGNLTIRQGDRLAALTDRLEQEVRRA
ncbi:hypothetical protein MKK75_14760 [Methylobacterium sp. J-030]|uniref:hypothetical protein n=1 Tax=Methylobacterium sp. J-030 TaxID=2836627 RepID=UPI001FB9327B|nr:hypothetical protein [Methylobacterium sp. J-030]MCJ2070040.1 hypothetical protein [Methylobacterium sp. J-030]